MAYSPKLHRRLSERGRRMALARWRNHVPGREVSADDVYWRMLEDRRGVVLHWGTDYYGSGRVVEWRVCHSARGRVDQLDFVRAGRVWKTGGRRRLAGFLKTV